MTSPHSPSGPVFSAPAKKQLGQHFLADRYYIDKIVMAVNPKDGDRLVEIGPGQGAITLPLLRVHPKMTVIEFDRDLIAPLTAAAEPLGELTIVNRDVLRVDFTELADGQPIRLVGNLPYNISSPILFHALEHAAVVSDMHFMLQKEVVDRMAAGPGSKVFGRLSVMLQAYCEVTSLFVVPPGAFRPPPKVDSAVVRLVPRDPASIDIKDHKRFAEVVKAAFGQRRKTLRNALNNVVSAEQFVAAGVRPDARAEQLDVAEFIALANAT
ncbi:16S rRNA (adenine(1518)-N(6)/adenine(1519)-N(6))-dimethyltransferase RsmA [Stenotrophomonas indicatrix]|jgi:16S rRNA (adenine1518-N6/adenine1519-N6)-dimethyltransferase|uniref:Ribosomal RNA small subunit methyltransferase A n=1 Tax=Stenotrophomonas indicatrix TaxID=2045451 RepID=A0A1W1H191_9GAMM|nr:MULTISPECIES: 16S rRNA (adenine(1518)-N(6)/adenine(1519)-N(6))-dimethyltransferase RsmA [Stenotrophomonas]EVT71259.1 16S rRNA methyltransferase [Stenotrophomonas maltophilia 5BA-I-2]OJH77987.1 MAG: 16S rRNA (adenine(1518)-N(6)/adenine(1519)-N(6))-dimethyltransferase [Stenotrophomonas maltophilia]AVJ31941.1 16S rRNA (adenine(1518)-N(6)/adenine(1519)-N(6))-dimethyltransferase RsmA [Stenotrophomonas sp. MYb57]EZP47531.1 Ribosomal RNA small subunit methyltransferase A [Stenotrophomonas sp. RIT30